MFKATITTILACLLALSGHMSSAAGESLRGTRSLTGFHMLDEPVPRMDFGAQGWTTNLVDCESTCVDDDWLEDIQTCDVLCAKDKDHHVLGSNCVDECSGTYDKASPTASLCEFVCDNI